MAGWGTFLGKIGEQFQGRIERLKNEEVRLFKEKKELERIRPTTDAINHRVSEINKRLDELDEIIKTSAKD